MATKKGMLREKNQIKRVKTHLKKFKREIFIIYAHTEFSNELE